MPKTEVSEKFMRAFHSGGGGIVRTCVCGRTWFNYMDHGCFEEGELEGLEKKRKKQPDKYFSVDYTVSTYVILGNEVVMGCPCNTGADYEAFLIRHARAVAEYLNNRADRLEAHAKSMRIPKGAPAA